MRHFSLVRVLSVAMLVTAVVSSAGCKWFRKDNALYAAAPENRALEVPPDLDLPRTDAALNLPSAPSSVNRSEVGTAAANGFAASGTRDQVFERVSQALALAPGLNIVNRAQLLGSFEVNYGGEQFLIRVAETDSGSFVSAVDPRGQPIATPAAQRLITGLKAAVAQ